MSNFTLSGKQWLPVEQFAYASTQISDSVVLAPNATDGMGVYSLEGGKWVYGIHSGPAGFSHVTKVSDNKFACLYFDDGAANLLMSVGTWTGTGVDWEGPGTLWASPDSGYSPQVRVALGGGTKIFWALTSPFANPYPETVGLIDVNLIALTGAVAYVPGSHVFQPQGTAVEVQVNFAGGQVEKQAFDLGNDRVLFIDNYSKAFIYDCSGTTPVLVQSRSIAEQIDWYLLFNGDRFMQSSGFGVSYELMADGRTVLVAGGMGYYATFDIETLNLTRQTQVGDPIRNGSPQIPYVFNDGRAVVTMVGSANNSSGPGLLHTIVKVTDDDIEADHQDGLKRFLFTDTDTEYVFTRSSNFFRMGNEFWFAGVAPPKELEHPTTNGIANIAGMWARASLVDFVPDQYWHAAEPALRGTSPAPAQDVRVVTTDEVRPIPQRDQQLPVATTRSRYRGADLIASNQTALAVDNMLDTTYWAGNPVRGTGEGGQIRPIRYGDMTNPEAQTGDCGFDHPSFCWNSAEFVNVDGAAWGVGYNPPDCVAILSRRDAADMYGHTSPMSTVFTVHLATAWNGGRAVYVGFNEIAGDGGGSYREDATGIAHLQIGDPIPGQWGLCAVAPEHAAIVWLEGGEIQAAVIDGAPKGVLIDDYHYVDASYLLPSHPLWDGRCGDVVTVAGEACGTNFRDLRLHRVHGVDSAALLTYTTGTALRAVPLKVNPTTRSITAGPALTLDTGTAIKDLSLENVQGSDGCLLLGWVVDGLLKAAELRCDGNTVSIVKQLTLSQIGSPFYTARVAMADDSIVSLQFLGTGASKITYLVVHDGTTGANRQSEFIRYTITDADADIAGWRDGRILAVFGDTNNTPNYTEVTLSDGYSYPERTSSTTQLWKLNDSTLTFQDCSGDPVASIGSGGNTTGRCYLKRATDHCAIYGQGNANKSAVMIRCTGWTLGYWFPYRDQAPVSKNKIVWTGYVEGFLDSTTHLENGSWAWYEQTHGFVVEMNEDGSVNRAGTNTRIGALMAGSAYAVPVFSADDQYVVVLLEHEPGVLDGNAYNAANNKIYLELFRVEADLSLTWIERVAAWDEVATPGNVTRFVRHHARIGDKYAFLLQGDTFGPGDVTILTLGTYAIVNGHIVLGAQEEVSSLLLDYSSPYSRRGAGDTSNVRIYAMNVEDNLGFIVVPCQQAGDPAGRFTGANKLMAFRIRADLSLELGPPTADIEVESWFTGLVTAYRPVAGDYYGQGGHLNTGVAHYPGTYKVGFWYINERGSDYDWTTTEQRVPWLNPRDCPMYAVATLDPSTLTWAGQWSRLRFPLDKMTLTNSTHSLHDAHLAGNDLVLLTSHYHYLGFDTDDYGWDYLIAKCNPDTMEAPLIGGNGAPSSGVVAASPEFFRLKSGVIMSVFGGDGIFISRGELVYSEGYYGAPILCRVDIRGLGNAEPMGVEGRKPIIRDRRVE